MIFTLLGSAAFAQDDVDARAEAKRVMNEELAKGPGYKKAVDDAAAKKAQPYTPLEVHIYDGRGGKGTKVISK